MGRLFVFTMIILCLILDVSSYNLIVERGGWNAWVESNTFCVVAIAYLVMWHVMCVIIAWACWNTDD